MLRMIKPRPLLILWRLNSKYKNGKAQLAGTCVLFYSVHVWIKMAEFSVFLLLASIITLLNFKPTVSRITVLPDPCSSAGM